VLERKPVFNQAKAAEIVLKSLHWCEKQGKIVLDAAVVMPDHLHFVMSLHSGSLAQLMHGLKGYTAYMINELFKKGEVEGRIEDYYVTFMAGIFRSVRFGAASAHGKANMIRFNYFKEMNAFIYNEETGKYKVDFENIKKAVNSLSEKILVLQGDGNYQNVDDFVNHYANIPPDLQMVLDDLSEKMIPVDVKFTQGTDVLGL